jgi:hypothetical protein
MERMGSLPETGVRSPLALRSFSVLQSRNILFSWQAFSPKVTQALGRKGHRTTNHTNHTNGGRMDQDSCPSCNSWLKRVLVAAAGRAGLSVVYLT